MVSIFITLLALLGITDSVYLAYEHIIHAIPPCSSGLLVDCGQVLTSKYAIFLGIPLGIWGVTYYALVFAATVVSFFMLRRYSRWITLIATTGGFLFSLYLVFLQVFVIHAICLYCLGSALITTLLFLLSQTEFSLERKQLLVSSSKFLYKNIIKKLFFQIDPEKVHEVMLSSGEILGNCLPARTLAAYAFRQTNSSLTQTIDNITFPTPIGLAAGFDYEAKLMKILPELNFGFETIGTITNHPYEGNKRPRLGRLPLSRSLMVNKGFKNEGVKAIISKMSDRNFTIPIGISVGRTNKAKLKTQKQSIQDIIATFEKLEEAPLTHAYYELNISCPNLIGDITFYPPQNLKELLTAVETMKLSRPIFVKMPIEKSDKVTLKMLEIIAQFSINGVIFGNLQKDRNHPSLNPTEVSQFQTGYFSGKPTWERSNQLISLCYKYYHDKLTIIGCGGVFSPEDAYLKFKHGASLVQLITGMIYEGPQLISDITLTLPVLLKKDGFTHISQAVGSTSR